MNDESRVSAAAFTKYKYFSYLRTYYVAKKLHLSPACLIIRETNKKLWVLHLYVCKVEAQENNRLNTNPYRFGLLRYWQVQVGRPKEDLSKYVIKLVLLFTTLIAPFPIPAAIFAFLTTYTYLATHRAAIWEKDLFCFMTSTSKLLLLLLPLFLLPRRHRRLFSCLLECLTTVYP